jgi:hypothetical protein
MPIGRRLHHSREALVDVRTPAAPQGQTAPLLPPGRERVHPAGRGRHAPSPTSGQASTAVWACRERGGGAEP